MQRSEGAQDLERASGFQVLPVDGDAFNKRGGVFEPACKRGSVFICVYANT